MSRALCIAAAILGFLSWVENIDTAAAQSNSATSGSNISICNDFSTRIYVALASQNQGGFNAAGWWSIEPNTCEPADFSFQGLATIYYAADSDQIKQGNSTEHEHWGNKINLYVSGQKFNFDNAQLNRSGAQGEMFGSVELTTQQQNTPVTITFHFLLGNTITNVTTKKQ
jgi:uncharacterized membrane protein